MMEVSASFKNHVLQLWRLSLDGLTLYFSFSFSLGLRQVNAENWKTQTRKIVMTKRA
jgi:hypothetical protein